MRALLLGAAMSLAPLGAQAVTYYTSADTPDLSMNTTVYGFRYTVDSHAIAIDDPTYGYGDWCAYTACEFREQVEWEEGFWHYGNQVEDLNGKTLNIGSGDYGGTLTFGPSNEVVGWRVWAEYYSATYIDLWSDPVYIDESFGYFGQLDDPSPYIGMPVYGVIYYSKMGATYLTEPGTWTNIVDCGPSGCAEAVVAAPIPAPALLLMTGLLGLGALRLRAARP